LVEIGGAVGHAAVVERAAAGVVGDLDEAVVAAQLVAVDVEHAGAGVAHRHRVASRREADGRRGGRRAAGEAGVGAGVGGAGDAVAVERREQVAGVRRAVREVAVVVIHGAHGLPPGAGVAAVAGEGAAGGAGEGHRGGAAREVPQPVEDGPRRAGAGVRQVAVGEVPDGLGGNVRLAVDLAAAGAAAGAAVHLGEVAHRGRRVRSVLVPVDVAHAGAGRAGVAVAAAVAGEEAGADAGIVELQGRADVAVGFTGAGGRGAVVAVEAVAPLVQRDGRELARVAAAATGLEEVQRRAVPVSVAGLVEVDVDGELAVEPGVRGQPAAADLLDAVDVVELIP